MTTYLRKIRVSALVVLGLAFTACSNDDNNVQPIPDVNYTTAENYLEKVGFKGSVLIRKGSEDIVRRGFGFADRASQIDNDPSLVYRIGSVTKSFTSAAIINLKREGLIESLDQPLSDFDDEFPLGDQITIRHLLTHHSGIADYVGGVEDFVDENNYFIEKEEILEVILESIEEDGLQFTPGEFFSYSNSNYFILGMLIEELAGMSYQEYLQEKVYTPLGLVATQKGPNATTGAVRAKGYNEELEVEAYQMDIAYSAGEIESTIADIEKWGDAMIGDYYTATEKQEVFGATYTQEGVNVPGAGWFTLKTGGKTVYHHGGDIDGFTSLLLLVPESDGMIVLLSNEQDKGEQRSKIMEVILENEF